MNDTKNTKFTHLSSHSDLFSNEEGTLSRQLSENADNDLDQENISLICSLKNSTKAITQLIDIIEKPRIGRIEARISKVVGAEVDVFVDFKSDKNLVNDITSKLKQNEFVTKVKDVTTKNDEDSSPTPWFPKTLSDLDRCGTNVLMYGSELDADHPGFHDAEYRKRRRLFTDIALGFKHGDKIPRVEYTKSEVETWGKVYRQLMSLYPTMACAEYIKYIPLLALHCNFNENNIPQLEDISNFLQQRTGFRLRPCAGFLSPRDFLASLAFRVFNCTQYIRHSSDPFYTPEPDMCHELFGHVPLLAHEEFAQFSQEIGLASLGASDEDISKLAACYLYTFEFGLCREDGKLKAYGAGLLSSIAELKHALTTPEKIKPFEPEVASKQEFYVTTFQPVYFLSENLDEAKLKMRNFVKGISRPFAIEYNPYSSTVKVIDNTEEMKKRKSNLMQEIVALDSIHLSPATAR